MTHEEKTSAAADHNLQEGFQNYKAEDFRHAVYSLKKEIDELQKQRQELMKQRRTLETVMYMMFPKEAVRDGYMSATAAIAQRLRRAKESNDQNRTPIAGAPSHGALHAEHLAKSYMGGGPPKHVVVEELTADTREGLPIKTIPKPKR